MLMKLITLQYFGKFGESFLAYLNHRRNLKNGSAVLQWCKQCATIAVLVFARKVCEVLRCSADQFARSSVLLIVVRRLGQLLGKLQHRARELVVPHHSNKYFSYRSEIFFSRHSTPTCPARWRSCAACRAPSSPCRRTWCRRALSAWRGGWPRPRTCRTPRRRSWSAADCL